MINSRKCIFTKIIYRVALAALLTPHVICMVETVTETQTVLVTWSVAPTTAEAITQPQKIGRKLNVFNP